jgi:tetratricopeptide (TPR) repeat protein
VPDRQATLQGALDWSWELLDADDRAALANLSVFRGGFSPEAADALVGLDRVAALRDRSLVVAREGRFTLLATVQEYAAARLRERGDASAIEARHGTWFARYGAATALDGLLTHGGVGRRNALALDLDNLLVACERGIADANAPVATATVHAAWAVLQLRGPLELGAGLIERVLALPDLGARERAYVEIDAAQARRLQGQPAAAVALAEAAATALRAAADRKGEGQARTALGVALAELARRDEAVAQLETAIDLARAAGDRVGEGVAISGLGMTLFYQAKVVGSGEAFRAAIAVHREVGNIRAEGQALQNLGLVEDHRGRTEEAALLLEQALAAHRGIGDRRFEGTVTGVLAHLKAGIGRLDEALALYAAALDIHRAFGNRRLEGNELDGVATALADAGRLDESAAACEAALPIHRETANTRNEGICLLNLGSVRELQDRLEDARVLYEAALAVHRAGPDPLWEAIDAASIARLELRMGRAESALERLVSAMPMLEGAHARAHAVFLGSLGEARAALGDREGASRDLDRAQRLLAEGGWRQDIALVLAARARALGDRKALREAGRIAEELACPPGSPVAHALALTARLLDQPQEGSAHPQPQSS